MVLKHKAYRFGIYPTKEQEILITQESPTSKRSAGGGSSTVVKIRNILYIRFEKTTGK